MSTVSIRRPAAIVALSLFAAACSDSTGSTPAGSISFNVATSPAGARTSTAATACTGA